MIDERYLIPPGTFSKVAGGNTPAMPAVEPEYMPGTLYDAYETINRAEPDKAVQAPQWWADKIYHQTGRIEDNRNDRVFVFSVVAQIAECNLSVFNHDYSKIYAAMVVNLKTGKEIALAMMKPCEIYVRSDAEFRLEMYPSTSDCAVWIKESSATRRVIIRFDRNQMVICGKCMMEVFDHIKAAGQWTDF